MSEHYNVGVVKTSVCVCGMLLYLVGLDKVFRYFVIRSVCACVSAHLFLSESVMQ